MHLVLIHGRAQGGKDPVALQASWEAALRGAWARLGTPAPADLTVSMPFYGTKLDELLGPVQTPLGEVVRRGGAEVPAGLTEFEARMLRQMVEGAGVTDADVKKELPQEVVARGPANWEWVQGGFRFLSRKAPWFGRVALRLIADVEAYLTRKHIRKAVDDIVRPALARGPAAVVAHSLGTVVGYACLSALEPAASVPLFLTVGSPLGIDVVKQYLRPPPLAIPPGVAKWVNAADERDYVALFATLDRNTFVDGIQNLTNIHNSRDDAHSVVDYLNQDAVAKRIVKALAP